jgi:hypothetical protein
MESPSAEPDPAIVEAIRAEFTRRRDSGADDMAALHGTAATLQLSLEDCAATLGLAAELARRGTGWRIELPRHPPR